MSAIDIQKSVTPTGIIVYTFHGELDNINVDTVFPQIIEDIGDFRNTKVLLNFLGLKHINSKGLGWLALLANKKLENDSRLVICNIPDTIMDVFEISGMVNIATICKNERSAYEAFLE